MPGEGETAEAPPSSPSSQQKKGGFVRGLSSRSAKRPQASNASPSLLLLLRSKRKSQEMMKPPCWAFEKGAGRVEIRLKERLFMQSAVPVRVGSDNVKLKKATIFSLFR
jgi:hypothetical protein